MRESSNCLGTGPPTRAPPNISSTHTLRSRFALPPAVMRLRPMPEAPCSSNPNMAQPRKRPFSYSNLHVSSHLASVLARARHNGLALASAARLPLQRCSGSPALRSASARDRGAFVLTKERPGPWSLTSQATCRQRSACSDLELVSADVTADSAPRMTPAQSPT